MNTSLRRISVMVMALIVLLLVNSTVTQVFRADGLRSDPRNQRVLLDEYARQRGQISANGQLLAYSVPTNGRYRFLRVYPDPFSYAPVTGFYSLRFSSTGLERAEDPVLNGSDERLFGRRLADFFTGRNPRGGNVDTTIVPRVQQAAWDSLQKGCNGPCMGSVVALEPSTGKILAMVSAPSYDPNLLATHDSEAQGETWQRLRDDPQSPMTNRAISERYPPGSTFKVITTAAALTAGMGQDEQLTAAPQIPLPDSTATLENYGGSPCGDQPTAPLREAFERSCNTAFVQLGIRLGAEALRSTADAFGFNAPGSHSARSDRVHCWSDGRCRRGRYVQHGPERRGGDTVAERDGGRGHRQRRCGHAAISRRPARRTGPHRTGSHGTDRTAARGFPAGRG